MSFCLMTICNQTKSEDYYSLTDLDSLNTNEFLRMFKEKPSGIFNTQLNVSPDSPTAFISNVVYFNNAHNYLDLVFIDNLQLTLTFKSFQASNLEYNNGIVYTVALPKGNTLSQILNLQYVDFTGAGSNYFLVSVLENESKYNLYLLNFDDFSANYKNYVLQPFSSFVSNFSTDYMYPEVYSLPLIIDANGDQRMSLLMNMEDLSSNLTFLALIVYNNTTQAFNVSRFNSKSDRILIPTHHSNYIDMNNDCLADLVLETFSLTDYLDNNIKTIYIDIYFRSSDLTFSDNDNQTLTITEPAGVRELYVGDINDDGSYDIMFSICTMQSLSEGSAVASGAELDHSSTCSNVNLYTLYSTSDAENASTACTQNNIKFNLYSDNTEQNYSDTVSWFPLNAGSLTMPVNTLTNISSNYFSSLKYADFNSDGYIDFIVTQSAGSSSNTPVSKNISYRSENHEKNEKNEKKKVDLDLNENFDLSSNNQNNDSLSTPTIYLNAFVKSNDAVRTFQKTNLSEYIEPQYLQGYSSAYFIDLDADGLVDLLLEGSEQSPTVKTYINRLSNNSLFLKVDFSNGLVNADNQMSFVPALGSYIKYSYSTNFYDMNNLTYSLNSICPNSNLNNSLCTPYSLMGLNKSQGLILNFITAQTIQTYSNRFTEYTPIIPNSHLNLYYISRTKKWNIEMYYDKSKKLVFLATIIIAILVVIGIAITITHICEKKYDYQEAKKYLEGFERNKQ